MTCHRRIWTLTALLTLATCSQPVFTQDSFRFEETFSAAAELRAGAQTIALSSSTGQLNRSISGNEQSECNAGSDRPSRAEARTSAAVMQRTDNSFGFSLEAAALANGAHFRTCSACVFNQCVGIHGNDRQALSSTRATGQVVIALPESSANERFQIKVTTTSTSPEKLDFTLSDPAIGALLTQKSDSTEAVVAGGTAREIHLVANLNASAFDEGGCCKAENIHTAQVQVQVVPTEDNADSTEPDFVLANLSESPVPRIAGGRIELGFEQVGALLFGGSEVCTATVVAAKTLVTAAHCVRGKATKHLTFIAAPSIENVAQERVFKVTGVAVPDGSVSGFHYDSLIFADDIALVYVDRKLEIPHPNYSDKRIPIKAVRLHQGNPKLKDLWEDGQSFLFIGFGYSDFAGGSGVGTKRRAEMQISQLASTTFKNQSPNQNTCKGDSGGPVLLIENDGLTLVGIVSTGDRKCDDFGINTRVDAFGAWIQGRLKD